MVFLMVAGIDLCFVEFADLAVVVVPPVAVKNC